jgi:hypothetical protein
MKDESRPTLPTERMRSAPAEPSRLGGAQGPASRTQRTKSGSCGEAVPSVYRREALFKARRAAAGGRLADAEELQHPGCLAGASRSVPQQPRRGLVSWGGGRCGPGGRAHGRVRSAAACNAEPRRLYRSELVGRLRWFLGDFQPTDIIFLAECILRASLVELLVSVLDSARRPRLARAQAASSWRARL